MIFLLNYFYAFEFPNWSSIPRTLEKPTSSNCLNGVKISAVSHYSVTRSILSYVPRSPFRERWASSPASGRSMWLEHVHVDSGYEALLKSMYPPEGLQFQKMGLQY